MNVSGKSIKQSCKAIEGSTFEKAKDGICLSLQNRMKDNEGEKAHSLYKVMFQFTIFRAYVSIWDKQTMDLKYFSICKSMDTLGV